MTFLHPWAIWLGLVGATLPIVVHFLTRPKPVRVPSSTVRFLREAVRQRRARHRLRDFFLLALRCLAILAFAFAIARPQWGAKPLITEGGEADTLRVVLLDTSQSMAATENGIRVIERAKSKAAEYLAYRPGLKAGLILAAAQPESAFQQTSTNFEALRDTLKKATTRPEELDVNAAIEKAARMLAAQSKDDQRVRELVIVSDFQRANWGKVDFSVLPETTKIQLDAVVGSKAPDNLAILEAAIDEQNLTERTASLKVHVGNYAATARKVKVEVNSGDETWRLEGLCPAGRETVLSESIHLRREGWFPAVARLVDMDDALAEDNVRYFVLHAESPPVYGLLTRLRSAKESRSDRQRGPNSTDYLEVGLTPEVAPADASENGNRRPTGTGNQTQRVIRFRPGELNPALMAGCEIIFIDHPGKLADKEINEIAGLLQRHRAVCYLLSEPIDATNFKRLLAAAGDLQLPVEFLPEVQKKKPSTRTARMWDSKTLRKDEPPFDVFGDTLAPLVKSLRFSGGLQSQGTNAGVGRDVLARYDDGSAALVVTNAGNGTLAAWNIDLNHSNLVKSQMFPLLLDELIGRLLRNGSVGEGYVCGEAMVAHLPSRIVTGSGLKLAPAGTKKGDEGKVDAKLGQLQDERLGVLWHWNSPTTPGVYEAYEAKPGGKACFAIAVNQPAEESRLDRLGADVFTDRLAGGRQLAFQPADNEENQKDEAWTILAVLCLLCVFGEWTMHLSRTP